MSELRPVPCNIELEKAVLGGIMYDPQNAYLLAAEHLTPDSFYQRGHGGVFNLMGKLHKAGRPPDFTSIFEALTTSGNLDKIGGLLALVEMQNSVPTASQVEAHAVRLADLATKRAYIAILTKCIGQCQTGEMSNEDIVGALLEQIGQIDAGTTANAFQHVAGGVERVRAGVHERIAKIKELKGKHEQHEIEAMVTPGITTGIFQLDKMMGGLKPGEVMTIAALTGGAKSALASSLAFDMSMRRGIPTGYVSLEMSGDELASRFIATASMRLRDGEKPIGLGTRRLDYPELTPDELKLFEHSCGQVERSPIFILDAGHLTLRQLRAETAKAVRQHKIEVVFLDYLHLLDQQLDDNEVRRLGAMANGFKSLCRALRIAGGMLCQVNREAYKAKGKQAGINHLLGSGSIAMASDYVLMIDGVAQYTENESVIDATLTLAKGRNCPTGDVKVKYYRELTRFYNP